MNKKNISLAFLSVAVISIYLYVEGQDYRADVDEGDFDLIHDIKYSFNLKNIAPRKINNARVWVSAPVAINANQKSLSLESESDPVIFRDENNNQEMFFNYESIGKNEIKHIVIDMKVAFSKQANKSTGIIHEQYLSSEEHIDIQNKEIVEAATALKGGDVTETTNNILSWLKQHDDSMTVVSEKNVVVSDLDAVAIEKMKSERNSQQFNMENTEDAASFGAYSVLNKQHNSKSGLLYLYLALNRTLGIPSRGVVGFDFSGDENLTASKATLWAQYYDAGYWHLVNMDDFKRSDDGSRFVAFKIIDKMPGSAGWSPFSVLHNEAAFVLDLASVKLTVR